MPENNIIYLDIAVLSQDYSKIDVLPPNNYIVELDEIEIQEADFKQIFYPYGDNFGLDNTIRNKPELLNKISFLSPDRYIDNGKPFSLLEKIIHNIEQDLNVTRNCFTTESLIELNKEISGIKYLCDMNCCSLLSCLSWSNIIDIIKNDYNTSFQTALLVVSVIFRNPDTRILPTIIKFKYKLPTNNNWFV